MSKKPKLKVIKTPGECCTRTGPCKCKHTKEFDERPESCPWWINSKEDGYCFWRFIRSKSRPDGFMQELVQSDLAQLFGYSNTKTHFVLRSAIEELRAALVEAGAAELVDLPSEEDEIEAWDQTLSDLVWEPGPID